MSYAWVVQDGTGADIRTSESFATQADAEAWMGGAWEDLAAGGGAFVVLTSDDETIYRMSLAEA